MSELLTSADSSPVIVGAAEDSFLSVKIWRSRGEKAAPWTLIFLPGGERFEYAKLGFP